MRTLTGLLVLGGLATAAWQFAFWEPRLLPIRVIEVQGELHHHSSEMLQRTIGDRLKGGILTADLEDLKAAADELPWVGEASIRRIWPDQLQVRVDEHKPIGRWNAQDLVTAEGVVFRPSDGEVPAGLPSFEGGDPQAPEVVARYLKWRDDLMLVGHLIQTLALDARGAWSLDLVSGVRLELGTEHVEERLKRFLANAAQLEAAGQPLIVDLRYSNGFSVTWRHNDPALSAQPEAVKSKPPAAKGSHASNAKAKAAKSGKGKAPATAQTKTDRAGRSAKGG